MTWPAMVLRRGRRALLAAPLDDAPGMVAVTDRDRPGWAVVRLTSGPFRDAASFARAAERAAGELLLAAPFAGAAAAPRRSPRRSLFVHLGTACNLRCAHCYVLAGAPATDAPALPSAELESRLDRLAGANVAKIVLSGGEPLLHPRLEAIVTGLRARGLAVALLTNAMPATERVAAWLAAADVSVTASLHGPDAATHERLTGAGSFAAAARGIELLARHLGPRRLHVNSTLCDSTVAAAADTVARAARLGAGAIRFMPLHSLDGAGPRLDWSGTPLLEWAARAARDTVRGSFAIQVEPGMTGRPGAAPDAGYDSTCGIGRKLAVSPAGELFPCALLMEAGDRLAAAGDGLAVARRAVAPLTRLLRARPARVAACRGCLLRSICRGGCAALARQVHGTMLAPDPLCAANVAFARAWFTALAEARGR